MRAAIVWAIAVLACAASAEAAIYKWVDEKGVTHYSETPPEGQAARQLSVGSSSGAPSTEPAPAAPTAAAPAPAAAADTPEAIQKRTDDWKGFCVIAQRNVTALESPDPVFQKNKEGTELALTDEQRAYALADAQRRVKKYCDAAAPR